eukprot:gene4520-5536_t
MPVWCWSSDGQLLKLPAGRLKPFVGEVLFECRLKECGSLMCSVCLENSHCSEGQYCSINQFGANTCDNCHPSCETCNGGYSTSCTSCDSSSGGAESFLVDNGETYGKRCEQCANSSNCGAGYFCDDNGLDENTCGACDSECLQCDGSLRTDCTACQPGRFLITRETYTTCEVCAADEDCGAGSFCAISGSGNACSQCDASCGACDGPEATECTSCSDGYALSRQRTCTQCASCGASEYCDADDGGQCKMCNSCGGAAEQSACEATGVLASDGRARVVVEWVSMTPSGGWDGTTAPFLWAHSIASSGVEETRIDMNCLFAADQQYNLNLAVGTLAADQPIRVGVWPGDIPQWKLNLETLSYGDAWVHPLDFAESTDGTLTFSSFNGTSFRLRCSGCQAAEDTYTSDVPFGYASQLGAASEMTLSAGSMWNYASPSWASRGNVELLKTSFTSTGSAEANDVDVYLSCIQCYIKLESGTFQLELETDSSSGFRYTSVLADLTLSLQMDLWFSVIGGTGAYTDTPRELKEDAVVPLDCAGSYCFDVSILGVDFRYGLAVQVGAYATIASFTTKAETKFAFDATWNVAFGSYYSYDDGPRPYVAPVSEWQLTAQQPVLNYKGNSVHSFGITPTIAAGMWHPSPTNQDALLSATWHSDVFVDAAGRWTGSSLGAPAGTATAETAYGNCGAEHNRDVAIQYGVRKSQVQLAHEAAIEWAANGAYSGYAWRAAGDPWSFPCLEGASTVVSCDCIDDCVPSPYPPPGTGLADTTPTFPRRLDETNDTDSTGNATGLEGGDGTTDDSGNGTATNSTDVGDGGEAAPQTSPPPPPSPVELSPPPPSPSPQPPPPSPPMTTGNSHRVKASLTLEGYSASNFGQLEQLKFESAVAQTVSVSSDAVGISSSSRRLRHRARALLSRGEDGAASVQHPGATRHLTQLSVDLVLYITGFGDEASASTVKSTLESSLNPASDALLRACQDEGLDFATEVTGTAEVQSSETPASTDDESSSSTEFYAMEIASFPLYYFAGAGMFLLIVTILLCRCMCKKPRNEVTKDVKSADEIQKPEKPPAQEDATEKADATPELLLTVAHRLP